MQRDLSRRSFLRGSALTTAGATMVSTTSTLLAQAQAGETGGAAVMGPDSVSVSLDINGAARALRVEPQTTLSEALRGQLGLTGTKIACNRGACSACTVWLDGQRIDEQIAAEAGRAALQGATPLSKNAYKLPVFETLVRRAILKAVA